ncbi:YbaK/EbsC family protein [Anaerofustis sp.]|uniref:YbaK/EbsC family protein n=1 Tax=Anaerofustis sp. TaxID=1872517 RepID=UPI0025BFA4FE|nr:YbaK/EbsC family protein [Anaerofustis sp.]
MAIDLVKDYFKNFGMEDRILEFDVSSATVELASKALGAEGGRIAKTLSFKDKNEEDGCILVVASGDAKIDNKKFKNEFNQKAKMLSSIEVEDFTNHKIGGVCPFAVPDSCKVYLDISLQKFDTVFPACGSSNSAIELTCDELFKYSNAIKWVDTCKEFE